MKKILAIMHTTDATISSLRKIVQRQFPEVTIFNLLDDSLLPEINREGKITASVRKRFYNLAANAEEAGADVLFSACSSIGGLIDEADERLKIPCVRIDEAMAEDAVRRAGKITVAATVASTLSPTRELLERKARAKGKQIDLNTLLIKEAGQYLNAGETEKYERLISDEIAAAIPESECIVLAQASMASALERLPQDNVTIPILSSPESGVASLAPYLKQSAAQ